MHDPAQRRRATRAGRQRGCSIYVPADELTKAGIDPAGPVPFYRTWAGPRGSLVVRFYRAA